MRKKFLVGFVVLALVGGASFVAWSYSNRTVIEQGSRMGGVLGPDRTWVQPVGHALRLTINQRGNTPSTHLLFNSLNGISGIAIDGLGNLYVCDPSNGRILEISPSGRVATVASGLGRVSTVAVDARGDVYTVRGNVVIEVTPEGTTYELGKFRQVPPALAADSLGNVYVAVPWDRSIIELDVHGHRSTFASWRSTQQWFGFISLAIAPNGVLYGTYQAQIFGVGPAPSSLVFRITHHGGIVVISKRLVSPNAVAVDRNGSVFVSTYNSITRFDKFGHQSVVSLSFQASGIAVDGNGNVYITDAAGGRIVEWSHSKLRTLPNSGYDDFGGIAVDPNGVSYFVARTRAEVVRVTQNGSQQVVFAKPIQPLGMAVDNSGNLFVVDAGTSGVKKLSVDGAVSTVFSGYQRSSCCVIELIPQGLATDSRGDLFIAGFDKTFVIEVTPQGRRSDIALRHRVFVKIPVSQTGTAGGIAVDRNGTIYVSESSIYGSKIVVISAKGAQRTEGSGLGQLFGVAVNTQGDVFAADPDHNRVVEFLPNGSQHTVAGTFDRPYAITTDASGNLYVTASNGVFEVVPNVNGGY